MTGVSKVLLKYIPSKPKIPNTQAGNDSPNDF